MEITNDKPNNDGMIYPNAFGDTYKLWVLTKAKHWRTPKCNHCDLYQQPECRMVACYTARNNSDLDGVWKLIK